MKKIILSVDGMTCSACSNGLEKYLNKQNGIYNASVNLVMANAYIEYDEKILDVEKLANRISEETGYSGRSIVLGHIQRGGAPSAFDRVLASRMGSKAIELLMEGKTSKVVGIKNNQIFDQDIDEALALERTFDEKLYEISEAISK